MERWRQLSTRLQLAIMLVIVGSIMGALYLGMTAESAPPGGALAAEACVKVVDAGREAARGVRSMTSFLSVVESQERPARSAANLNARYQPIAEAIVSLRSALVTGGDVGTPSRFLASECG